MDHPARGTLIENAVVITMNAAREVFSPGHLLVRDGRIAAVGTGAYPGSRDGLTVQDVRGRIVMPGLVNAHHHSYGNLLKGQMETAPLEIYFLYVLAEAPHITPDEVSIACALGTLELLESGCTAVLDHLSQNAPGLSAAGEVYRRMGIRALLTPQFSDLPLAESLPASFRTAASGLGRPMPAAKRSVPEMLAEVEETIRACHRPADGVRVAVGPSAPLRCSDELLTGSFELARRYGVPWHTHLLESRAQLQRARERYDRSMVAHLDDLGMLSPAVSLAHTIWVSADDLDRIRTGGAAVVHVPVANLQLGDGVMPLPAARARAIPVALGTDSSACAGCQSMFEAMKLAAILPRSFEPDPASWPTAWDALEAATIGGARALGLQDQIGSLEAGKSADLLILRRDVPSLTPLHEPVRQIVFGRPESAVEEVWVHGHPLVTEGQVQDLDREGLLSEAAERGAHLLRRCRDAYEEVSAQTPAFAAAVAALARATS